MTWNDREREKEREKDNLGKQPDLLCQTIFDIGIFNYLSWQFY